MLLPHQIEVIPEGLLELYDTLEAAIMEKLASKITSATKTDMKHALADAHALKKELQGLVNRYKKPMAQCIKDTYNDAIMESCKNDFDAAGKHFSTLGHSARQKLLATMKNTNDTVDRLTRTTAAEANKLFLSECNDVFMKVNSGAFSYSEALEGSCNKLAAGGITSVFYNNKKPVMRTIESAIRANILTSVNHLAGIITMDNCDDLGCDLVEVSAHEGARPEHEEWQGRIYSRSGKSDKYPSFDICDYGSATGLCGINCRHSFYPYIEGRKPHYTKEALEKMRAKDYEYKGEKYTRYEAEQLQRGMERKIRKYKRAENIADAMGVTDRKKFYNNKVIEWQTKRAQFCKSTGLHKDTWREKVGKASVTTGTTGASGTLKSTGVAKDIRLTVDNSLNGGKIAGKDALEVMSFSDADGSAANIHYKDIDAIEKGYKSNCSACVIAFEARLRGYDVEAMPYIDGNKVAQLARHPYSIWVTSDKKTATPIFIKNTGFDDLLKYLSNTIKINERYILQYASKGLQNRRHILSLFRDVTDVLYLYDPQNGEVLQSDDICHVLKRIDYSIGQGLLRVDNLALVPDLVNGVVR